MPPRILSPDRRRPARRGPSLISTPPPIDRGWDAVVAWANALSLRVTEATRDDPLSPRLKLLVAATSGMARVKAAAASVEATLRARELKNGLPAAAAAGDAPPSGDLVALPLWHAFAVARLAYQVVCEPVFDADDEAAARANLRTHLAGVAVREVAETEAFLRHHGIRDAARVVREAAQESMVAGETELEAQEDLLKFCSYVSPGFRIVSHLRKIADALERVANGELKRLIICMPPRWGKPVWEEEIVTMGDGARRKLKDVRVGDFVLSAQGNPRRVREVFLQGRQPIVEIETASGRTLRVAVDHPMLTPRGWVVAGELTTADILALTTRPRTMPSADEGNDDFALAGYAVGNGCSAPTANTCAANFTNNDPEIVRDFYARAESLGFAVRKARAALRYELSTRTGAARGPRDWLREKGLVGTSHTKRVPPWVFNGTSEQIGLFVGAYCACDGTVERNAFKVTFSSVSRGLLADTQALLLRLGIASTLRPERGTYKKNPHLSWRLWVTSEDDVARFAQRVAVVGAKRARFAALAPRRRMFESEWTPDPVVALRSIGELPCRCLTVDVDHTFTVQDVAVHNSFTISQHFPAWYLGKFPDRKIIATSCTTELAEDFGRAVRNVVQQAEFERCFPGARIADDSQSAKRFHMNRGGVYYAVGMGGTLTGRGAHVLIIDDPVKNREDADSDAIRRKHREWYTSTSRTRLMPGGAVVVVQTRWREDDFAGWLLEEKKHEGWEVISLPAIAEDDEEHVLGDGTVWNRRAGDPLDPERYRDVMVADIREHRWRPQKTPPGEDPIREYALADLEDTRRSSGSRDWSALYQQRPVPAEGGRVQLGWFKRYRWARPPSEVVRVVMSFDTGQKDRADNDPSVCTMWAETPVGHYLLDVWRERVIYPHLRREALRLIAHWQPHAVLIEDKGNGTTLIQDLLNPMPNGDVPRGIPVIAIMPDGDKVTRWDRSSPLLESGWVWIPDRDADPPAWLGPFEHELSVFPLGKHDDQVDSVSQYLNWARERRATGAGVSWAAPTTAQSALLRALSSPWTAGRSASGGRRTARLISS